MSTPERYTIGDFVLERSQRRALDRQGVPLALTPRLFDALLLFAEHPGALLDKDWLMQSLWPGLVVEENNLSQVVSGLRRALGDDAQGSRYIQTVPRRGYRLVAAVTPLPAAADFGEAAAAVDPAAGAAATPLESATPVATAPAGRPGRRRVLGLGVAGSLAAATAAAATAWHVWRRQDPGSVAAETAAAPETLAVLPFKPLVDEGRDELLEVGMADSLIAQLSMVPGLAVRSVGSVRRYAGPEQDPLRAGRELDVAWIVDGSLQRRGGDVRVTARLLRTADGSAAWSGRFDATYTGVFDLQNLISDRVMEALAPILRRDPAAGSRTVLHDVGGTRSTDAYQLYLAASRLAQGGRADRINQAIALFNQALAIDPAYARAWIGLAWAHRHRLWNDDAVPNDVFGPANVALRRALAAAPGLAEAQAGLAFSDYWFGFDWPAAERRFRAALAVHGNVAIAHYGLALLLLTQDRVDEGFVRLRAARELDPMSPVFNTIEASLLLDRGLIGEARVRLGRAFAIAPDFWLAHVTDGMLLAAEQRPEQGLAALRHAVELARGTTRPHAVLAARLAQLGRREEARAILGRLQALAQTRYVPPTSLAAVHAALGESKPALDALESAFATRDTRMVYLKDDPHWTALRREPRFVRLLRTLKLDGYGPGLSPV